MAADSTQSPASNPLRENPTRKKINFKRKTAMWWAAGIFLVIGFLWLLYWLIWGQFRIYTDDAYVNGNMVQIMSQVPGTVIEIRTDDTQLVLEGQPIVKLDPTDMKIALEKSKAALASTVRQVKQLYEKAEQAQAELVLRNADLMKAQLDLRRRVGLVGERAISREELQHYQTTTSVAQAQYDVALHNMRAALALVANSTLYTHPEVERAKTNLLKAYLNFVRTTIVSPVTGFTARRTVQVGQQIVALTPLLAIVPLNQVWIDANYKESQLQKIRIGQPVILYADAYSDITYHGKIIGLSPGTGAAFSILPPQNATGNWIKIVQRLPVRVGLSKKEIEKNPLQIGLSMRVTTNVHNTNGPRLATVPKQKPIYSTTVFANQLDDANKLIQQILENNATNISLPNPTTMQGVA